MGVQQLSKSLWCLSHTSSKRIVLLTLSVFRDPNQKSTKKAKKKTVKWEDSDEEQFDDAHLLYPASPVSAVKERPSRMADDNLDYAGFHGTPRGAPTSDKDLRHVAPLSTLNT